MAKMMDLLEENETDPYISPNYSNSIKHGGQYLSLIFCQKNVHSFCFNNSCPLPHQPKT